MNIELCRRALLTGEKRERLDDNHSDSSNNNSNIDEEIPPTQTPQETPMQKEYKRRMLSSLCNIPLDRLNEDAEPVGLFTFGVKENIPTSSLSSSLSSLSSSIRLENPYSHDTLRVLQQFDSFDDPITTNPMIGKDSVNRKIPSAPSRILDAPDLVDDYYLNLISWGQDNILAVALAHCVYMWNATTGDIQHLTTLHGQDDSDLLRS